MSEIAYVSAATIAAEAMGTLMPIERVTVAEHALQKRYLENQGGGYVGRWHHDVAPYLVEPMECCTDLNYQTIVVPGPGQSGKTEIAQNYLHYSVDVDPANMLWYMQTDPGLQAFVKTRIDPMIELHDAMRRKIGSGAADNSLHFKRFAGMTVELLAAVESNLINKSAPRIVADEVDAYNAKLGDIKVWLDVRRQTFKRQSKILALSHPDMARGLDPETDWTSGIMALFKDSDMRLWHWACPHCGAWSSPAPIARRFMYLKYREDGSLDDVERSARLICPVNGCEIEDRHRRTMNLSGRWIGRGQEMDEAGHVSGELVRTSTAGFWIVGVMSPFIMNGIGGLARARVKAEREYEIDGEEKTLRQVIVKQWGFPYERKRKAGTVDANVLADRAERELTEGVVPDGVRFLILSVDVQIAHFEWLLRGFGVDGESWVIAKGRIPGDPATSEEDWDQLLPLFEKHWPLGDGSGRTMGVRAMGYDSHGAPGVTEQAYAAFTRWRRKGKVKFFGKAAGRDVYSVLPMRGGGPNSQRLAVTYPDTNRKANVIAASGDVPVCQFNPNLFKDALAGQLKVAEPGPKYVHVPYSFRSKQKPHAWFEQLTAEDQLPNGRWEKRVSSARNEATDLMTMSHAMAHLHGLSRIPWDRPPEWARPWDTSSMVFEPEPDQPDVANAPAPPQGAAVQTVATGDAKPRRSLASRLA